MDLPEFIRLTTIINRLAKRALFAEKQVVALDGQCTEWKRIADDLKAERNALVTKIHTIKLERDSLKKERDALRAECDDLRRVFSLVHGSLGIKQGEHIGNAIEALKNERNATPCDPALASAGDVVRLVRVPTPEDYPMTPGAQWLLDYGKVGETQRIWKIHTNSRGIRVAELASGWQWPLSCVEIVGRAGQ